MNLLVGESKLTTPMVYRFGERAITRVKNVLEVDDPICNAVLSSVPIDLGTTYGFFSPSAESWLPAEKFESCIPIPRDELSLGRTEDRQFIAEFLNVGEPDRICLFFSVWFDHDPGYSEVRTPYLLAGGPAAEKGLAVWYFLQGPLVTIDEADEALADSSEWPAICILTRTGLGKPIVPKVELDENLIRTIAENTQFIMVGAFDCGERLVWSRSEESFQKATVWFSRASAREQ